MKKQLSFCALILLSSGLFAQGGLIGYYSFTGNAFDSSGNGNDGTVVGPVLTADRHGVANSAYYFDGTNDYINLPSADFLDKSNFTYSLWAQPYSMPSSTKTFAPLSIGGSGGDHAILLANQYSTSFFTGWMVNSYNGVSSSSYYQTGSLPSVSVWYHLVLVRDSANIYLYINGALQGQASINNTQPYYGLNPKAAVIGARYNIAQYFHGVLDEIGIYDRALSATEISAIYTTGISGPVNGAATIQFIQNPVHEALRVDISGYRLQAVHVTNSLGQAVPVPYKMNDGELCIDTGKMPAGLYFLTLTAGAEKVSGKFMVAHP